MKKGRYREFNLVEGLSSDGDFGGNNGYFTLSGEYAMAFYGVFGGATVSIVFFTEQADGGFFELPVSNDLTFTAAPAVAAYGFPSHMPFKIRVSGSTATTDLSLNVHKITP